MKYIVIHGNLLRTHCVFHKSLRLTYLSFEVLSLAGIWKILFTTLFRELNSVNSLLSVREKIKKKQYQIFFCKDINYFCDLAIIILEVSVKTYLICFPGRCFSVLECRPRVWILSHTVKSMQSTFLSNSYFCSVVIQFPRKDLRPWSRRRRKDRLFYVRAFSFLEFPVTNCLQLKPLIFEYARRNFVFWITIPDWMFFLHVSIRTRAVYCTHFSTGHKGLVRLISIWPTFFAKFLHWTLCFQKNIYPALPPNPF